MTPDDLVEFCLSLPQTDETFPFGPETSVFKTTANGKIFALSALAGEPFTVSLKCDPEEGRALRDEFPGQITPGYHLNKKHWITIVLDSDIEVSLIEQLLRDSHALVRPKIPRAPASR
ncbi:MmcQ/YjbR family DNA-binding protein [Cryobacterium sp. CG_9.6]|uniref:MmcQ/YjbR family DNA-binding protein n=1 Tax=Cryobacterium sp. CG_9.6 TaxID=2760710 RepID=UPI0024734EED|nr:MmcQ/YjbR family DNA-binding protein [Cryobacterium sp. CG_9.6]MDH6236803.1 putative DNA-binding protein (MmcQ/YjbR family) [Cryobacterium sp. CG_9.6]